MKHLYLITFIFFIVFGQIAFAQKSDFSLLQKYPEVGQKVTLVYRPDTPLRHNLPPKILVHFAGTLRDREGLCYQLSHYQGYWKCDFVIVPETKSISVLLCNGTNETEDWQLVYQSPIYKNKKPVEFAHSSMAGNLTRAMQWAEKKGPVGGKAIDWYRREVELYPKREFNINGMRIADVTDSATLFKKIAELKKTNSENMLTMAGRLLRNMGRRAEADSLDKVIRRKFPKGVLNNFAMQGEYYNEPDLAKKEILLKQMTDSERSKLFLRTAMAISFFQRGDLKNYETQLKLFKPNAYLAEELNRVTESLTNTSQDLERAEPIAKQALALWLETKDQQAPVDYDSLKKIWVYNRILYNISNILEKRGKPAEALTYMSQFTQTEEDQYTYNWLYIRLLLAAGKNAEAVRIANTYYPLWGSSKAMTDLLKPVYLEMPYGAEAFRADTAAGRAAFNKKWYVDRRRQAIDTLKMKLVPNIINKPAPDFTLKDLDGNVTRLKAMRGKTVVIGFGASWSKNSFNPPIQLQKSTEKDHPDVTFLIIDTYNSGDKDFKEVKKFVAERNYTHSILMDDKTSSTARAYGAIGLPALFVIDKSGHIRFQTDEQSKFAYTDSFTLTAMIELAQQ